MRHRTRVLSGWTTIVVMSAVLLVSVAVSGQGRGAAPPQGPAAGAPAPQPLPAGTPASQPPPPGAGRQGRGTAPVDRPGPNDKMVVDPAEADAGRTIWTAECVSCHGADARGGNGGPNLVRSVMVLHDRYGSGLGPFLKEGHPMQSGKPSAALTDAQIVQLSHFLRQRLTDTLRGSPMFDVKNVLTGDAKAGEAYFNGEGKCATCHSATGDMAGIGTRLTPVNIQQRVIFPFAGGRGRGGAAAAPPARSATTCDRDTAGWTGDHRRQARTGRFLRHPPRLVRRAAHDQTNARDDRRRQQPAPVPCRSPGANLPTSRCTTSWPTWRP